MCHLVCRECGNRSTFQRECSETRFFTEYINNRNQITEEETDSTDNYVDNSLTCNECESHMIELCATHELADEIALGARIARNTTFVRQNYSTPYHFV